MNRTGKYLLGSVLALISLAVPAEAYAHGVTIEYSSNVSIEIAARYDSGEPMAGAQVTVYAPDEPSTPWLTGACDEEGRYTFVPDTSRPGTWDVRVRKAGHGEIVHIPISGDMAGGSSGGYTPLQIALMAALFAWGSAGTALYFLRKRTG